MAPGQVARGSSGKEAHFLTKFRRLLGRIDEEDRRLLLYMAQKMVRRKPSAAQTGSMSWSILGSGCR